MVLHFPRDTDRDGVPDVYDLCPSDATPGGADEDWDGDGHGNACDLCPLNAGPNGDLDGDGIGDACDCDRDGDLCNQREIGTPVSAPPGVDLDPVFSCPATPGAGIFDQRPLYSDGGGDNDSDGRSDDCDADDDNDLIPDDGSRDGIDVYTPCRAGNNFNCDDNCRETANASQRDRNDNGLGDRCDPICNESSPSFLCTPETFTRFEPIDFGLGFAAGLDPLCPECLLTVRCLEPAQPQGGGTGFGGCPGRGLGIGFADGIELDLKAVLVQVPYDRLAGVRLLSDLDGDGFSDVAVALSRAVKSGFETRLMAFSSSGQGQVLFDVTLSTGLLEVTDLSLVGSSLFVSLLDATQGLGGVAELDASSGKVLRLLQGAPGEGFGASMQMVGSRLLIGAPFAAGGAGRIFIVDRCSGETVDLLEGPVRGGFLGLGPMAGFSRAIGDFVAVGSPLSNNGNGEVLVYRLDPPQLVARLRGGPGDALGTALATLPGLSVDGDIQGFIGAPGADGGRGAVYLLNGALELGPVVAKGGEAGDALGTSLLLGGDALRVGVAGARLDVETAGAFVTHPLDEGSRAAAPFGSFEGPPICEAPGLVIDFETSAVAGWCQPVAGHPGAASGQPSSNPLRVQGPPESLFPPGDNSSQALQIVGTGARFDFSGMQEDVKAADARVRRPREPHELRAQRTRAEGVDERFDRPERGNPRPGSGSTRRGRRGRAAPSGGSRSSPAPGSRSRSCCSPARSSPSTTCSSTSSWASKTRAPTSAMPMATRCPTACRITWPPSPISGARST